MQAGKKSPPDGTHINKSIYAELCVIDGLIYRGDKIMIPDKQETKDQPNIQTKLLNIAHEGNLGGTMMKRNTGIQTYHQHHLTSFGGNSPQITGDQQLTDTTS